MGADIAMTTPSARAQRTHHAVWVAIVGGLVIGAFTLGKAANQRGALCLENDSPSEPEGLYLWTPEPPAVGRLVTFMAPAPAAGYVGRRLPNLRRIPVLKELSAGPGSFVCTRSQRLVIDGQVMAAVAAKDRRGELLPQWKGCRRLGAGEWFAYSNRVPNSFDSRYFGPIRTDQVIAVYRPLWIAPATSR